MSRGSGVGLVRWPNVGSAKLLTGISAGPAPIYGVIFGQEARGFARWTFQIDPTVTPITATIKVYGTTDFNTAGIRGSAPGSATVPAIPPAGNWFLLGTFNLANQSTDFPAIEYNQGPLLGVYAQVSAYTGGTFDVLASAVP